MSEVKNIPDGWVETTLGEICNPKGGKRLPKGMNLVNYKTNHPYIRITDFNGNQINKNQLQYVTDDIFKHISRYIVNENDVIITIVGTVGLVAKIDRELDKASLTENCTKLVDLKNVDHTYLYYFLMSKNGQYEIVKNTVGAVQKKLPIYGVQNINITLPTISEQKSIAEILTAFDDKIELLQDQNKTLEEIAQTIFTEWFGKYDVEGELPEGWKVAKVNDFIASTLGGDYGKEEIEDDYNQRTLCLRGTDLPDMKMGTPEKAPIRYLKKSKLERCKLKNGDIVIEISGGTETQSTGRVMYINNIILENSKLPMTCVNFCRIVRPADITYSYFLYSLFDYLYRRKVFFNWENGTTGIKNLNLNAFLEGFELIIPDDANVILHFHKLVESSFIKIQTNNTQIQTLTKTRDELLPRLMSGEVRVKI